MSKLLIILENFESLGEGWGEGDCSHFIKAILFLIAPGSSSCAAFIALYFSLSFKPTDN